MSKKTTFTTITPLPSFMTRDAAISFLRDHLQMIDLNPLVINRERLPVPPAEASPEEMHAHWYQITDKITYIPGVASSVSYNACMHDLADGLQTHTFAPAGVELRGRWTIGGGAVEGEGINPAELGVDVPRHGLYLMETTELRCNFLMTGFIKKNLKGAHAKVVEKIVEIARDQEPKPPVPAKDPGYHSRGPSQASTGKWDADKGRRPSYDAGGGQPVDPTLDSRKKFTPEYERYRQNQDAQAFGQQPISGFEYGAVAAQDQYRRASPPSHVAELPSGPPATRPVSELP